MHGDVEKGTASSVYVLPEHVHGREVVPASKNAAYRILEENYADLLIMAPEVAEEFDALRDEEAKASVGAIQWASDFLAACATNGPLFPKRRGGALTVEEDSKWSMAMIALITVYDSRTWGVTANEIKLRHNVISDGISGSLSKLHATGVIARLAERRPL